MRATADPAASIERIYDRINESERAIAHYEEQGMTHCAKLERRRLAGLRSARTRIIRSL